MSARDELAAFAADVLRRVSEAPERYRFGRSKTFIAALAPTDDDRRMLVDAHRAGLLTLARCDLVAAVDDPSLITASEVRYLHATWHLVEHAAPRERSDGGLSARLTALERAADAVATAARREKNSDATIVAIFVVGLVTSLELRTIRRDEVIAWTMRTAAWSRKEDEA